MRTGDLLARLRDLGIRLWVEEDRLRYSAPKGALTPELRASLLEYKAELIDLLRQAGPVGKPALASIPRVPRGEDLPLSFAQQRLWFLDQMAPGNPFYNIPVAIPMEGSIHIVALKATLNEIVRRHETFRTTFGVANGQPVQRIARSLDVPLPVTDLRQVPAGRRQAEAERRATEEAQRPFDLERGPLLRANLLQTGDASYLFLLTMHHIVADGWSLDNFFHELDLLYEAFSHSQSSPLPELPLQYADFAVWQRNWLRGSHLEELLDYWKRQLASLPILELPTVYRRPSVSTFRGAYHRVTLPADLLPGLHALGHAEGATLFMTLLAAFKILLHRYTGQDDIVVGAPVAGRTRSEIKELIGFFVNTLVFRTNVGGDPTFREVLQRVRYVAIDAYAHQELPFEKLVEELHPERDLSRNPLCQVTFQLWHLTGRRGSSLEVERGTAIFDLAFRLWEGADGISGGFEYSTDLFDEDAIRRLTEHYLTLLAAIVANPDAPVSQLSILPESERHQLLVEWNETEREFEGSQLLHELCEAQAARTPDRVAVFSGHQSLTFRALDRRANWLAHNLSNRGIGPDSLVGIYLERSLEMVTALLGVLKAGGAYLPLDPSYPRERLAFMIEDAGVDVVLTQRDLVRELPPAAAANAVIVSLNGNAPGRVGECEYPPQVPVTPANLAYMLYTSGSTGRPKGVMISHQAICNHMQWMQAELPLHLTDRVLQKTPFSFDASVWEFWAPLISGACLVMAKPDAHADSALLIGEIREHQITVLQLVPSVLKLLLDEQNAELQACTALRRVFCGGEPLTVEHCKRFFASSGAELYNLYGPTEATIDATFWHCRRDDDRDPVPIGRPVANTIVYILDRYGQPVPVGVPGELHLGGAGLARGYHHRPELTAERFVADPFSDQSDERLFRTGDLTRYRSDGSIEFLGRLDHQVKVRGYRIELGEIESVLRAHTAVDEAVVTVREVDSAQQLIAYVVGSPNGHEPSDNGKTHLDTERVDHWQEVYDEAIYHSFKGLAGSSEDPTFNTIGWNSSFTGQPLPAGEMREWLNQTAARIKRWQPHRILEIGCGTGMLLFRLAPDCERYVGTDFSAPALTYVKQHLALLGAQQARITLHRQRASHFKGLTSERFDAVILNSVIQYFPSVGYLVQVLEKAVRVTAPGGKVFLGDVRSLPLLKAFHTAAEMHRAPDALPSDEVWQSVLKHAAQEEELVLDPSFFVALQSHLPRISHVQIQPKRGRYDNEISRFRYDVTLHVESDFPQLAPELKLDWQRDRLSLAGIEQWLSEKAPPQLRVTGVPNHRLQADLQAVKLLAADRAPATAGELRTLLAAHDSDGIDPNDAWDLEQTTGYVADVRCSLASDEGAFDLQFVRRDAPIKAPFFAGAIDPVQPWHTYANSPIESLFASRLALDLRRHAQERLPHFMVPSGFVLLEQLPVLPNGKVDRAALASRNHSPFKRQDAYVASRTPVEAALAAIWSEVLGIDNVSANDDFFDLGGHSLLAAQVASQVRSAFHIELPLRYLFMASKLADLAQVIEELLITEIEALNERSAPA